MVLELHGGARVMDAIHAYYTQSGKKIPGRLPAAEDRYGNSVAPDGELTEGSTIMLVTGRRKKGTFLRLILLVLASGIISSCSGFRQAGSSTAPGGEPPRTLQQTGMR